MAIILPANTLAAGGFDVDNSCRLNGGDDAYMHKTLGTPTSTKICTISFWWKQSAIFGQGDAPILSAKTDTNNRHIIYWSADSNEGGLFKIWGKTSGSVNFTLSTTQVFRDPAAWQHHVIAIDTNQSVATNRVKWYKDGTQITSFSETTYPGEDALLEFSKASSVAYVGAYATSGGVDVFGGANLLSEFVFIDGQQLTPTSFGEYDEDSPTIWKPIDVSGLTFGNNGFYLDFEDSANLGNDANGGTDLTEVNLAATDQTTDTPTNNFCVMNPLNMSSMGTLSEGNCLITGNSASNTGNVASTMAAKNGKWYAECKVGGKTGDYPRPGFQHTNGTNYGRQVNGTDGGAGGLTDSGAVYASDGDKFVSDTLSSFGASFANDNIINLAIDCDNGAAYVGVNNTWSNSGDPGSAGTKTGAILTWTPGAFETGFAATTYNSSFLNFNFGNPAYANSSDAADADGYGKFEYAPPTGYFALCTKNLAEYG